MSKKINDGGSAFPLKYKGEQRHNSHIEYIEKGMSLRDYFAAKALSGLLAYSTDGPHNQAAADDIRYITDYAYNLADAMLKSREIVL